MIPFPAVVDSTMLGTFRSCPQKFFRMYLQHWKPSTESVHLIAGAAFAAGLEASRKAYYEFDANAEEAVALGLTELLRAYGDFECPPESAKNPDRMAGALEFYFDRYPLGQTDPLILPSGRRAIEFSFAEPLPFNHPETGNPVLYTGRADAICHFAEGVWVVDEKTTSSLGSSWINQWGLRSQFTGYCWAARRNGYKVDGVLVRGVSILKTKYDTAQVPTGRSDWEIARWERQVVEDLRRMRHCWETGYWDWNLDHACTEYGGCALRDICKSPEPESWLPMQFVQRIWDPLRREEIPLSEA